MRRWILSAAVMVLGLAVSQTRAYTVSVVLDPGTTNVTTALTGFSTTGAMMVGMDVLAYFADGSTSSATWAKTGSQSGEASGTGFLLKQSGDTFYDEWTLKNTSTTQGLTRLVIDAGPGDTVFDTTFGDNEGTLGSAPGKTFDVIDAPYSLAVKATYRDEVALMGHDPVGDLFRYLDIQFTNTGGLAKNKSIEFYADTDNLKFAGDLTPVPEPSAALLMLGGVVLLGLNHRVKRYRAKTSA